MKKKTPNGQRPTPNIELGKWRVAEVFNGLTTCHKEIEELIRIFVASVPTAERNAK